MSRQFLALFIARGMGGAVLALMNVLVARWAGPTDFGVLSTTLAAGAFVFVLADLGSSSYISREAALGHGAEVARALHVNSISSAAGCALMCVVTALAGSLLDLTLALTLVTFAMALEKNVDTALAVPIARREKLTPAVSIILRRVAGLVALVAAYYSGLAPLTAYGVAVCIGASLGQVHMRLLLRKHYSGERAALGRVLSGTVPFLVSNLSASVRNLDTVIVAALLGRHDAGLYAAPLRLVAPLMLVPNTIGMLVLPAAARKSPEGAAAIANRLVAGHLLLLVGLAAVFPLAPAIVTSVLGDDYREAGSVLAWTLIALPFVSLTSPLGGVLQGHGHERIVAVNGTVFALVLVPAVAAGALLGGPVGAAVALGVVYAFKACGLVLLIRKHLSTTRRGSGAPGSITSHSVSGTLRVRARPTEGATPSAPEVAGCPDGAEPRQSMEK